MSGSYQQYKNDTSAFTTWLGRAAAACGYKNQAKKVSEDAPAPVPVPKPGDKDSPTAASSSSTAPANPQRLKGKARKQAKQAQQAQAQAKAASKEGASADNVRTVTYEVTTQDLLAQIEAVSTSKIGIHMPPAIKQLLNRAVEARQRCSQWYESTNQAFDGGGHRYFIRILQDALMKLAAPENATASSHVSKAKVAPPTGKDKSILELRNLFSHLEVEDVDESFHLSATDVALYTKPKASKPQDAVDIYELELEKAMEDAFAVFCFFEDLHHMKNRVIRMWKNCAAGRTDVVLATIGTQAAVEAIRQAEKELCGSLLPGGECDDCYEALSGKLAFVESGSNGDSKAPQNIDGSVTVSSTNGSERRSVFSLSAAVEVTPFDNFIFRPAARTLLKFMSIAAMTEKDDIAWPAPIPPLRCQYISFPEEADRPENKKLQKDDEFLTQVLLDLQLPDHAKKKLSGGSNKEFQKTAGKKVSLDEVTDSIGLPQEDILLKTLRPVWMEGKLSVTSTVAAQLLLDIAEACKREPTRFHKQLKLAAHHAAGSFKFTIRPDGAMETGDLNWPRSGMAWLFSSAFTIKSIEISKFGVMKNLHMQISTKPKMYTYSNSPAWLKSKWDREGRPSPQMEAAIERMDIKFINPSTDDEFALKNNPMYSGSLMLRLLLQYYPAGLSLANHHLSIFVVAHLYNALKRLHLLDGLEWPVLERIMELHKRALFADAVPATTNDMADRLSYRLNAANKQKVAAVVDRYSFKEDPGAAVLRSLLDDECAGDRALWLLEQYIQTPRAGDSSTDLKKAVTTSTRTTAGRKRQSVLTPDTLIDNVEQTLGPLLQDLSIDYIRLTKRCRRLLEDFRKMWNLECQVQNVDVRFDSYFTGTNTNDMGHLGVAYQAFQEAKAVRAMGIYTYRPGDGEDKGVTGSLNDDPDDPWRHGLGLMTAAKVFRNLITTKENKDISFAFPYASHDAELLASVPDRGPLGIDSKRLGVFATSVATAAELRDVLSSNTYAVVDFYTDYDGTHGDMRFVMAELARDHALPGFLAVVIANIDDMNSLAAQYCKEGPGRETFVFFKEGKQVAVTGKTAIYGKQKGALMAAVEKLGGLAKKRSQGDNASAV